MQQYVLTHEFPAGAVVPGHSIKILSIELMTCQQADEQGHELQTYTMTNMVYIVYVDGPFYTMYAKTFVGVTPIVLEGYEIFDAHTGDILEWGLPSLYPSIAAFLKGGNKRDDADDAVFWEAVPRSTVWHAD